MKKQIFIISSIFSMVLLFGSCGNNKTSNNVEEVKNETPAESEVKTDVKEVKIGTQTWLTTNLDVSTFQNGNPIPEAKTAEEWKNAGKNKKPSWCNYENDVENGKKYGKLYNWHAVADPKGLCPKGWHVPTVAEWKTLRDFLGKESAGAKMKSSNGWNENGNGSNQSGFSGLPGGERMINEKFYNLGKDGNWWSSTGSSDAEYPRIFNLHNSYNDVSDYGKDKEYGMSVRCLKD